MFARVITIYARPGMLNEAINLSREVVIPSVVSHPGFHHWYGFVDWEKEKSVSIALWENEADMNHYAQEVMPGVFKELGKYIQVENAKMETLDVVFDAPAETVAAF